MVNNCAQFQVNVLRSLPAIVVEQTKTIIFDNFFTFEKAVPDINLSEQPMCLMQSIE
jgi:hypothetical protein